ncbi:MAG: threonine aldolase family protein [Bacteroidota bacterium]
MIESTTSIEFRSDTFTKPTESMLQAMMAAAVGDDVFGEDPTVNALERSVAEFFGMEAGLFCPSGTMTNQIAIQVHTQPGDEVICEAGSHVYFYEGGGIAKNAGAQVRLVQGTFGQIAAEQILPLVNPDDVHRARTRLVSLENTCNRGGGSCYDLAEIAKIRSLCDAHGLGLHLDGARLMNAIMAKQEDPKAYGKLFHSISLCLSKGLGAPVGSVLLGSTSYIKQARRVRKVMGGGMRQAGYLAAAGLYAMQHNINRLAEDHAHAKQLAVALRSCQWVGEIFPVETNIVIFEVAGAPGSGLNTAQEVVAKLQANNIRVSAMTPTHIRLVTHLDVTQEMIHRTVEVLKGF